MRVLIDGEAHTLADAYRVCGGKLKCCGHQGRDWETINFEAEHGPYGRSVFLERLWTDSDGKSESATMGGRRVALAA